GTGPNWYIRWQRAKEIEALPVCALKPRALREIRDRGEGVSKQALSHLRRQPHVLSHQPAAQKAGGVGGVALQVLRNGKAVHLAVVIEAAAVDVGGAGEQKDIVDDHHFGVYIDRKNLHSDDRSPGRVADWIGAPARDAARPHNLHPLVGIRART